MSSISERRRVATRGNRPTLCRGQLHVLLVLAVGALGCALPAAANAAGASYVAMGDSYTSAPGVMPESLTAPPECGQSAVNYPHLVAAALDLSLTDVSCGGAKTENFTVAQYPDQPPQFDALSASTEVVTVSMGGNDDNIFGTLAGGCSELDYGKPNVGAPCKKKYGAFLEKGYEEITPPQEQALAEIRVLAPNAKVFVVGYPEIAPADGYCPSAVPWTTGDLAWFHRAVEAVGNRNLKRIAHEDGAIAVNTFGESAGHNACEPVGVRWIEPIFGSLTGVALHPNAEGEQNDAFDVEKAMLTHGVR